MNLGTVADFSGLIGDCFAVRVRHAGPGGGAGSLSSSYDRMLPVPAIEPRARQVETRPQASGAILNLDPEHWPAKRDA